jgi:hypothetical protein
MSAPFFIGDFVSGAAAEGPQSQSYTSIP